MKPVSRRSLTVGFGAAVAAIPALGLCKDATEGGDPDPVLAAMTAYKALKKKADRLDLMLDEAEVEAARKFGHRPFGLIDWRNYTIGGEEIDYRREVLLDQGVDPYQIEREYHDAKRRWREAIRAEKEWDKRTGVAPLRRECEGARRAMRAAERRMVRTKPTTPAGAAALADYARAEFEIGLGPDDPFIALKTVAVALRAMGARS